MIRNKSTEIQNKTRLIKQKLAVNEWKQNFILKELNKVSNKNFLGSFDQHFVKILKQMSQTT